jgi:hypothetical protein
MAYLKCVPGTSTTDSTNRGAGQNPGVPYALHATERGATQFLSPNTEGVRAELKALGYESEAVEEVVAPRQNYVKIPAECPHCNAKQEVHVEARTGLAQRDGPLPVVCVKCEKGFEITVPALIIGGSFHV